MSEPETIDVPRSAAPYGRPGFAEELRQLVEHYRELCREQGDTIQGLNARLATAQSKLAGAELRIVELYQQLHGRPPKQKETT